MDGRIHGALGDGQYRSFLDRRAVQESLRELYQQSLEAGRLHLPVRPRNPFRDRHGRTERHRTLG